MSCGKPCACPTYRDHLLSVGITASAMPTRSPAVVAITEREKRWDKDMPAYKAIRADGVQPRAIDGSAELQARANDEIEVTSGEFLTRGQAKTARGILDEMEAA